ncbi:hypothetical protein [Mucilaginibacter panaciglaebae]
MRPLAILFILILTCGCGDFKTEHIDPVKIKVTNVQRCLDSIYKEYNGWAHIGYKIVLVKDVQNTQGFDSLHIGPNKIHLEVLPKGLNLYRTDPNINHTVYMRIFYKSISETRVNVKIEIFHSYADWEFNLEKRDDFWIIKKVSSGIS